MKKQELNHSQSESEEVEPEPEPQRSKRKNWTLNEISNGVRTTLNAIVKGASHILPERQKPKQRRYDNGLTIKRVISYYVVIRDRVGNILYRKQHPYRKGKTIVDAVNEAGIDQAELVKVETQDGFIAEEIKK